MELLQFIADSIPMLWMIAVAFTAWNIGKRVLTTVAYGDESLRAEPYSKETPEEALQKAKRRRIQAEHEQWDAELQAITPGKCPHCTGPKRHTRLEQH
jgi:hypothetical protein